MEAVKECLRDFPREARGEFVLHHRHDFTPSAISTLNALKIVLKDVVRAKYVQVSFYEIDSNVSSL